MKKSLLAALLAIALPAAASAGMGFYGWGFRLGLGDDPDQIIVGVHQDLGEFAPRIGFQPSFEIGTGDDHTVVSASLPAHYRFKVASRAKPYAGGGLQLAWIDRDHPRGKDDSEFDISPFFSGGVAWPAGKSGDFLLELSLGTGDAHSAKVFFGWMFRAR